MKDGKHPNPNIIVGDFTYIADSEFEHHVMEQR